MQTACPHCDAEFEVQPQWAGTKMACPFCNETMAIAVDGADEPIDELDDFLEDEPPASKSKTCPMCGAANRMQAIRCQACGDRFELSAQYDSRRHSRLGIASFLIAIGSGIGFFGTLASVAMAVPAAAEPDPMFLALVGFIVLACLVMAVVGAVLGIVALFLPDQKKLFAVLGVLFNAGMLIGIAAIMAIGLIIQAQGIG